MGREFFDTFCAGCTEYKNHICTNTSISYNWCSHRREAWDINMIQVETIMLCKAETYRDYTASGIPEKCLECPVKERCCITDDPVKVSDDSDIQESPISISNIPECEISKITGVGVYYRPGLDVFDVILQLDCGRFQFTTTGKYMPTPKDGWKWTREKEGGQSC